MLQQKNAQWILLLAVFVIATCGLIYELVVGTLATYLMGDSITQFSTIIGVYLFAMGIGAYLSKFINGNLLAWFIKIELLVGCVGGASSGVLFLLFPVVNSFRIILYAFVLLTGILVGLEIPLLMRILQEKVDFKDLVSRVFTFDYIGALLASLIFPFVLVPYLGLIRTSLLFGILNILVGVYLLIKFKDDLRKTQATLSIAIFLLAIQLIAFVFSDSILSFSESLAYHDNIVYATSSPYQRIVLTRNKRELRLYLNNNLQFSSADEYRYHEALVHPAMTASNSPKQILVLGGGDGLAVREILKYTSVEKITLVDLDKKMTSLFSSQEVLKNLNQSSLTNKKVTVINDDAFIWLKNHSNIFDCIIIDFPDPSNFSIGKLYSTAFYKELYKHLSTNAFAVIQSTSPLAAPNSFWCVSKTLNEVGLQTTAYHNYVPSFGEWGYVLASKKNFVAPTNFAVSLKYVSPSTMQQMLVFPNDMLANKTIVANKLNNQSLVNYFEDEWNKYLEQ
jgi:spermidine synthase